MTDSVYFTANTTSDTDTIDVLGGGVLFGFCAARANETQTITGVDEDSQLFVEFFTMIAGTLDVAANETGRTVGNSSASSKLRDQTFVAWA